LESNNIKQEFDKGIIFDLFDQLRSGLFFDKNINPMGQEDQKAIMEKLRNAGNTILEYRIQKYTKSEKRFAEIEYSYRINELLEKSYEIFAKFKADFLLAFTNNQSVFLEQIEKIKKKTKQIEAMNIDKTLKEDILNTLNQNVSNVLKSQKDMYNKVVKNLEVRFENIISILESELLHEKRSDLLPNANNSYSQDSITM